MNEEKRKELARLVSDLNVCANGNLPCRLCSHKNSGSCRTTLLRDASQELCNLLAEPKQEAKIAKVKPVRIKRRRNPGFLTILAPKYEMDADTVKFVRELFPTLPKTGETLQYRKGE